MQLAARVLAALVALVLSGCGVGTEPTETGEVGPLQAMIMGTGPVGGTYYPLGGALAQLWNDEVEGLTVSTVATDASVENLRGLDSGRFQLGMAVNGVAAGAVTGGEPFAETPLEFSLIGNLYPEAVQIAAAAGTGIEALGDLDGRTVAVGPAGSGTRLVADALLDAADVTPAETVEAGFGDAAVDLAEGRLDAAIGVLAVPDTAIGQAVEHGDATLVGVPEHVRESVASGDPALAETEIPAGTYEGIHEPTPTLRTWASLYAASDLDEDQIYAITAALYENAGDIPGPVAAGIDVDLAADGRGEVELHPGAARYLDERGRDPG